jgi:hypothetical protein
MAIQERIGKRYDNTHEAFAAAYPAVSRPHHHADENAAAYSTSCNYNTRIALRENVRLL